MNCLTAIAANEFRAGVSGFVPDDRCGFSTVSQLRSQPEPCTCIAAAFHDGDHEMIPTQWIPSLREAESAQQFLERMRAEEEMAAHRHIWGPHGCWCGATAKESAS